MPILCHKDIIENDPLINEGIEKTIDEYHKEGRVFPHGQLRLVLCFKTSKFHPFFFRYSVKKRGELQTNEGVLHLSAAEKILNNFDPNMPLSVDDRFNMFRAMVESYWASL